MSKEHISLILFPEIQQTDSPCCVPAGEQVVVFRDQEGKASVLEAYCPHLGANLAVGGRVVGNCIECPFHGWQFRGDDGRCVKIPYAEKGKSGKTCIVFPLFSCLLFRVLCLLEEIFSLNRSQ